MKNSEVKKVKIVNYFHSYLVDKLIMKNKKLINE